MLAQQVNGALGQRIALVNPALPANVRGDVVGREANRIENTNRFGQHLVADAIPRHDHYLAFCHIAQFSEAVKFLPTHSYHGLLHFLSDKLLDSTGDHQRLRHAAQRRKGKFLAGIANRARGKIDFDRARRR